MWYDEIKKCGPFPGCESGKRGSVGHFTAMIWKGTTVMGCAKSTNGQVNRAVPTWCNMLQHAAT